MIFPLFLLSQTKSETENWIKQKIENYAYQSPGIYYEYNVEYQDGNIWIGHEVHMVGLFKLYTADVIPINKIGYVKFEEKEDNAWLTISTVNMQKVITSIDLETKQKQYLNKVEIILSKSILNENYPTRIKSAFDKLIEYNGGNSLKEAF
tara:strand:- start:95 stop:544 length:450 start_codon:yes stop_codon:yes gene_type:complete